MFGACVESVERARSLSSLLSLQWEEREHVWVWSEEKWKDEKKARELWERVSLSDSPKERVALIREWRGTFIKEEDRLTHSFLRSSGNRRLFKSFLRFFLRVFLSLAAYDGYAQSSKKS